AFHATGFPQDDDRNDAGAVGPEKTHHGNGSREPAKIRYRLDQRAWATSLGQVERFWQAGIACGVSWRRSSSPAGLQWSRQLKARSSEFRSRIPRKTSRRRKKMALTRSRRLRRSRLPKPGTTADCGSAGFSSTRQRTATEQGGLST